MKKELLIPAITVFISMSILISSLIKNINKLDIPIWYIGFSFIFAYIFYIGMDGVVLKRASFNEYLKNTKGVKAEFFLKDRILGISAKKWKRRKRLFVLIAIVLSMVLAGYNLSKYSNILDINTFFTKDDSIIESNNTIDYRYLSLKENKISDLNISENKKTLNKENNTMGREIHIRANRHQINAQTGNNATMSIGTFGDTEEIVKLLKESNSTEFVELIEEGNKLLINSENNKSKTVNILDWATKITKLDKAGSVVVDKATQLIDSLKDLL